MNINITVDRIEDEVVILKTKTGETINWPKDKLPENTKEGSILNFIITDNPESENTKKEIAKNILNELLHIEEEKEKEE